MSTTPDLPTREDRYQFLLESDVLVEGDDDSVAITEDYDAAKAVYHDTYADVDDETFHETVASLFGLSVDEAGERVAELEVTRAELVAFLALDSYLDTELDTEDLVEMAGMVAEVTPESPVPDAMETLTDDDYERFLAEHPDAVVFVWTLHCDPCDAMKAELDEILAAVPDGVAVAGVDGESVPAFRREFDVSAAPSTLAFADGGLVDALEGRRKPQRLADLFDDAF